MTADLLKHVEQSNLVLAILMSMVMCDLHGSKTIIDLIFVSSTVHDQLIHCQVATELDKTSDHKPIETFFYFNVRMREMIKHRS